MPQLRNVDILVQVHDALRPGVTQALTDRFRSTHDIQFIHQLPRLSGDLPHGIQLKPEEAMKVMDEGRGDQNDWLWMSERRHPG
jgi:hypothetical protein